MLEKKEDISYYDVLSNGGHDFSIFTGASRHLAHFRDPLRNLTGFTANLRNSRV